MVCIAFPDCKSKQLFSRMLSSCVFRCQPYYHTLHCLGYPLAHNRHRTFFSIGAGILVRFTVHFPFLRVLLHIRRSQFQSKLHCLGWNWDLFSPSTNSQTACCMVSITLPPLLPVHRQHNMDHYSSKASGTMVRAGSHAPETSLATRNPASQPCRRNSRTHRV